MSGDTLYGMTRAQWCRAAEYWIATKGKLPPLDQGSMIVEHWMATHTRMPSEETVIVIEGKDPHERFDGSLISWVAQSWNAILKKIPL